MCDPGTGMIIASAIIGAAGTYQSSKIQKEQARFNRRMAEDAEADAKLRGQREEALHRRRIQQLVGRQRAAIGASGAAVDEGTTLDIIGDTYEMGEFDILTIRNNAAREAWGFNVQGQSFAAESALAGTAQIFGTGSTLLAGGADAYSSYRMNREDK